LLGFETPAGLNTPAVELHQDASIAEGPWTPAAPAPELPVTPYSRQRRPSSRVRDSDNIASALEILYPDSPVPRNRRRTNQRPPRRITFASIESSLSPPRSSSRAPSSPASLPPESESGQSQSETQSQPETQQRAPSPPVRRGRPRGPAGNRTHHQAADVWTFYEKIESKQCCKFCRCVPVNLPIPNITHPTNQDQK